MRGVRFLLLTFLFFLLLLGIQVLAVCVAFIVLLQTSTRHATGIGLVAGGGRELILLEVPMVALAALGAWFMERYWQSRAAVGEPKNQAPLL